MIYRRANRAMCLAAQARVRARKRGFPFALTREEIDKLQTRMSIGYCELSGVAFNFDGPRSAFSPSLDRIVPERGYVYENIRVVCHALNAGMGDWGADVLMGIAKAWVSK